MKKFWVAFFAAMMTLVMSVMLVACDLNENPDATKLSAPVVKIEGKVISWDAVENAENYEIYSNKKLVKTQTETSYTITETVAGTYKYSVKATSTDKNYADSDFSNEVNYTVKDSTNPTGVTFGSLLKNIDLTKGVGAKIDATINTFLDDAGTMMGTITVDADARAKIADNKLNLDLQMKAEHSEYGRNYVYAFLRGNKTYYGEKSFEKDDDTVFDENSLYYDFETDNSDTSDMLVQILPVIMASFDEIPVVRLLNSQIIFTKDNDGYTANVDVVEIINKLIAKVETVVNSLNKGTTIGEIYNSINGNAIIETLFGDQPLTEFYAQIRAALLMSNPDMSIQLPENLDGQTGLITMLNQMLAAQEIKFTFPEASNKTISQYVDSIVELLKDKTLGEAITFIMSMTSQESPNLPQPKPDYNDQNESQGQTTPGAPEKNVAAAEDPVAEDPIETMIEQFKAMVKQYTGMIKPVLSYNSIKFTIKADANNKLTSIAVDFKIDQSLLDLFSGSTVPGTGKEQTVGQGSATLTFSYDNITLYDVSKVQSIEKLIEPYIGTWTLKSQTSEDNIDTHIFDASLTIDYEKYELNFSTDNHETHQESGGVYVRNEQIYFGADKEFTLNADGTITVIQEIYVNDKGTEEDGRFVKVTLIFEKEDKA